MVVSVIVVSVIVNLDLQRFFFSILLVFLTNRKFMLTTSDECFADLFFNRLLWWKY